MTVAGATITDEPGSSAACPTCRHGNPADYAYCGNCGYPAVVSATGTKTPVAQRGEFASHETTRLLCAAVYLDNYLARQVTALVIEKPRRAVATSPGVDLVAVARYTIAARRRRLARDVVLGILLVALIVAVAQRLTPLIWIAILAGWSTVYAEACVARWGACAATLRPTVFRPSSAPRFRSERAHRRLGHIARYSDGNVTVYSGFHPFTGYGVTLGSWSLLLDTTIPADTDGAIESFTPAELNERLRQQMAELTLPDIRVRDRLYISGEDVHHDRRLLPDPLDSPAGQVGESVLAALLAEPEDRARPYLTVEIPGWKGEVVWSGFIRLVSHATSLFVEVGHCVLPPLRREYSRADDRLLPPRPLSVLAVAGWSALRLPIALLACVPEALEQLFTPLREWLAAVHDRRLIRRTYTVDHGALISVREAATDTHTDNDRPAGYRRYFQLVDHERYAKTIDKRILRTVSDFLAEKNIDGDELNKRGEMIINSSVTIGGNATLSNSSIGGMRANAETTVTGPRRPTAPIRYLRGIIGRLSAT